MKRIGILVLDDVEELDVVGSFEVFGVAQSQQPSRIDLCIIAQSLDKPVRCANGLRMLADYDFDSAPRLDILVLPGGIGTRAAVRNADLLQWVSDRACAAELVVSICTGARITLATGLATGRRITTHHSAIEELRADGRAAEVIEDIALCGMGQSFTRPASAPGSAWHCGWLATSHVPN